MTCSSSPGWPIWYTTLHLQDFRRRGWWSQLWIGRKESTSPFHHHGTFQYHLAQQTSSSQGTPHLGSLTRQGIQRVRSRVPWSACSQGLVEGKHTVCVCRVWSESTTSHLISSHHLISNLLGNQEGVCSSCHWNWIWEGTPPWVTWPCEDKPWINLFTPHCLLCPT